MAKDYLNYNIMYYLSFFLHCIKNCFLKIKQFFIENWEEILYSIFLILISISSIIILRFVVKYYYFLWIIDLKKSIVSNYSLDPFSILKKFFFEENNISFKGEPWYKYLDWPIDRLISSIPESLRSEGFVFSLKEGWKTSDLVGKIVLKLYIINLITGGQITSEVYDLFINQMLMTLRVIIKDTSPFMLSTPKNFNEIYDYSHSEKLYVIHKNFLKSLFPLDSSQSVTVEDIIKIENFFLNEKSYTFIFSSTPAEFSNIILTLTGNKNSCGTYFEFFFNNFSYIINLISNMFS